MELERAWKSLNEQTFQSFEWILIDDHSTDDSFEWASCIADKRVKLLRNNRQRGAAGARNAGLEAATGSWVAFLDSDDWWAPRKLESVAQYIQSNPSKQVFYSACQHVDEQGRLAGVPVSGYTGDLRSHLGRLNPIRAFSAVVVKKDLLAQIGGFDEDLPARQDMDLYLRLAPHAEFQFINEALVFISMSSSNKISSNVHNRLHGWILVYEKHKQNMTWKDRLYQQKRIVAFARRAGALSKVVRYLPGAALSKLFL